MPIRPKQVCRSINCHNTTRNRSGYCEACEKKRPIKQSYKKPGYNRANSNSRGYNAKWRKARAKYLEYHPYCRECMKQGVTNQATVIDHIIPHRGNQVLFWDESNWQPLCTRCHNRKTGKGY